MTAIAPHRPPAWPRLVIWAGVAALLAAPAVAMQFTREVNWTASDFAIAAILLGSLGMGLDWAARRTGSLAARAGYALTVVGLFALVWITLAVGIIGSERDPANLMFIAVVATCIGGACLAHFHPAGMAKALLATALVQAVVGLIALTRFLGSEAPAWPGDVIGASALFVAIWLAAAALFAVAARRG